MKCSRQDLPTSVFLGSALPLALQTSPWAIRVFPRRRRRTVTERWSTCRVNMIKIDGEWGSVVM